MGVGNSDMKVAVSMMPKIIVTECHISSSRGDERPRDEKLSEFLNSQPSDYRLHTFQLVNDNTALAVWVAKNG